VNQTILLTLATLPSLYIGYNLLTADKKDRIKRGCSSAG